MKSKVQSILIIFVFVLLSSCYKKCPEFNKKYLSWMPYNIGDELIFINQNNDTLSFIINRKYVTDEHKIKRIGKCSCGTPHAIAEGTSYEDNNYRNNGLTFEINYANNINEGYMSFEIFLGKYNNHLGYCSKRNFESYIDTMTINGFFYNEIVVLERDTINFTDEIWKVIVANNYGIVKFYDRETGDEWTLQH
jgi:hypothetical protein